ncbi:unnamed protein product [Scytosiphon promiscuus]
MPGRKKGRQKGAAGSKAQSARKWNDALRDAREDLAWDPKQKLRRGGDTAPPRLSTSGFRSLATLLRQRVRADELDAAAPPRNRSEVSEQPAAAPKSNYFSNNLAESRPRRTRSLMALCVSQIGRDFLAYRADDDAIAEAFLLLPAPCLSRLSRSASARGTVADHNIGLLCSPGVSTLWLRGRFTDQGAAALMPALSAPDERGRVSHDLAEVYREGGAGGGAAESVADTTAERCESSSENGKNELAIPQAASRTGVGRKGEAVGDQEEDWETAYDRIEASLRGCVSLTSLDLSSPRVTADFVKRLVVRIPSLRKLGLRGSLGVVGGPDVVCDHIPRLAALREINVSHCTWFCDITLRRLAKTLSLGFTHPEEHEPARPEAESVEQLEEGSSGWGAAFAASPAMSLTAFQDTAAGSGTPVAGVSVSGEHRMSTGRGGAGAASFARHPRRFRTFTVVCARTAVTEKGAKAAESMSPGLLVVLEEEQPSA